MRWNISIPKDIWIPFVAAALTLAPAVMYASVFVEQKPEPGTARIYQGLGKRWEKARWQPREAWMQWRTRSGICVDVHVPIPLAAKIRGYAYVDVPAAFMDDETANYPSKPACQREAYLELVGK